MTADLSYAHRDLDRIAAAVEELVGVLADPILVGAFNDLADAILVNSEWRPGQGTRRRVAGQRRHHRRFRQSEPARCTCWRRALVMP